MHTSAGRGQRKEVTFFQKSGELSVGKEGVVVAKDAWNETGNSRCHLQEFTTWSHRWLIIESIPSLEFGISSPKHLSREGPLSNC